MSLNIKNERVHDLVRQAAGLTGKSQTSVVEEALRKYLEDIEEPRRQDDIGGLVADMQRRWRESAEPPFEAEDLYDPETGLPA